MLKVGERVLVPNFTSWTGKTQNAKGTVTSVRKGDTNFPYIVRLDFGEHIGADEGCLFKIEDDFSSKKKDCGSGGSRKTGKGGSGNGINLPSIISKEEKEDDIDMDMDMKVYVNKKPNSCGNCLFYGLISDGTEFVTKKNFIKNQDEIVPQQRISSGCILLKRKLTGSIIDSVCFNDCPLIKIKR